MTLKALIIGFIVIKIYPNAVTESWLLSKALPELVPPWEKDHLAIYIMKSVRYFRPVAARGKLVAYVLRLIMPDEKLKKYWELYADNIL